MARIADPVALGLCRPPMFLWAPYDSVVVNGMLSVALCLALGELFWLPLLAVPLHVVAILICQAEPRAFELVQRHMMAMGRGRSRRLWRGVSVASGRIVRDGV